jgi:hypothetical protein
MSAAIKAAIRGYGLHPNKVTPISVSLDPPVKATSVTSALKL